MWILAEDHNDRIKVPGAKHKLEDKLLWGSDYPMMLGADGIETYADILRGFARQLRLPASALKSEWKVPTPGALPELGQLVKKLVCDNPRRFLSA